MRRCVGEEAHTYPPDAHCTWYLGAWGACAREANTIRQLATICRFDQHSTVRVRTFISNLSQVAPSCHTPFSPWNAILQSTGTTSRQRPVERNPEKHRYNKPSAAANSKSFAPPHGSQCGSPQVVWRAWRNPDKRPLGKCNSRFDWPPALALVVPHLRAVGLEITPC